MTRLNGDRGSMTAFVAVTAFALVMVAGLVYDGGQVVNAHARARNDARKAARAGAQAVDTDALRATGVPVLDPAQAAAAAEAYLSRAGVTGRVEVAGDSVTVTVTISQDIRILPLPDRTVTATQTATALDGGPP